MHERNTFLKFITLVYELKHWLWAKSAVKLRQAKESSVKEVIINYLHICLAMCIDAVYMKCVRWEKSHPTVYCVSYSSVLCLM